MCYKVLYNPTLLINEMILFGETPNDTAYKRLSCHSVHKLLCKLCRNFPPPEMGPDLPFFLANRPWGPAGCLALLLIKEGDVEINLGPTNTSGFAISAINKYMVGS